MMDFSHFDKTRLAEAKRSKKLLLTDRLVLMPLLPSDAPQAFKWVSDPMVAKYMRYCPYTSVQKEAEWIDALASDVDGCELGVFVEDGSLIGSVGYSASDNGSYEVGYHFNRNYWNHGYCTESLNALLAWTSAERGVKVFCANYAALNTASGRVLEKCGFVFERNGEFSKIDGSETFLSKHCVCNMPVVHSMRLAETPFEAVSAGHKTIELRLNDYKRQAVSAGDLIVFSHNERKLFARVLRKYEFACFADLYAALDLSKCGYLPLETRFASPADMEEYYPVEKQQKYGVVGIEFELIAEMM